MKTFKSYISEKAIKVGSGNIKLKDVAFQDFDQAKPDFKKFRIKAVRQKGGGSYGANSEEMATLSGTKQNIVKYLMSDNYGFDDIEDVYDSHPELFEASMGNARRKGNSFALNDQITFLERIIKNAKKSKLSHIESKAKAQAKAIARIEKAAREIDDAVYDLQILDKYK